MNADRAAAYGRVMKILSDVGPAKLQPREQDLIREAADAMLFADDLTEDAHARMAYNALQEMAESLVESDRWLYKTADQLMTDIEACGPTAPVELLAAA